MSQTDVALGIAIVSAILSAFALGWNVYRDVLLKARVRTTVTFGGYGARGMAYRTRVIIEATNHGPGTVKLTAIYARHRTLGDTLLRRPGKRAMIMHDLADPVSATLPVTLEPGDAALFPFQPEDAERWMLGTAEWTEVGLRDSFGRVHWAPRPEFLATKARLMIELAPDTPETQRGEEPPS